MSVTKLVQNATKAPKGVTDLRAASIVTDDAIQALKSKCKHDKQSIEDVARYLLLDLENRSTVVRLRALSVIDALFFRSKVFRKAISPNIRAVAECAGFLAGKPIDSAIHREFLQHRVKELLELWDTYYGEFLPEIRGLTRHMKEFLRLEMPDIKARAIQYAVEVNKKKETRDNKILARGRQVLLELNGGKAISLIEVRDSLSELNSCFSILFPGVIGVIPKNLNTLKWPTVNGDDSSSGTHMPHSSSERVIWECDGLEVDDDDDIEKYNEKVDSVDDNFNDDDVAWEDGIADEDDKDGIDSDQVDIPTAPYTLEIRLPMTAAGIESADNMIILQTIREISSHLTSHALPVLSEWREALSAALGVYNHCTDPETSTNKRKWDAAIASEVPTICNTDPRVHEKNSTATALRQVCALDQEVQTVLKTRCRTLLGAIGKSSNDGL